MVLDTAFLALIPAVVGVFALSSFLADGFLPTLLLSAGVLSQAVAALLAFGLRINPTVAPMSESVFDAGLWLAGYFHVGNVIACISGGAGIEGRSRKWTTVGVGVIAVGALLALTTSLTRGALAFGDPQLPTNPFALRFVILTSALPFLAAAVGAWSLRGLTSRLFLGWYALALMIIALGRATEMLTGVPEPTLHLLARLGFYLASTFLLGAVLQTEGAYRGLGVPISGSLTRLLHDRGITHQSLVEISTVAMIAIEPDGSIQYWNPTAHQLLRLKDRAGANLTDLAETPVERERLAAGLAAMLRPAVLAGPISRFETRLQGVGDRVFPAEISLLARRSDLGIDVALVEDITERKQTELALERTSADLGRRARLLQELTLELTQAEYRERRRLAVLLHDHLQQLLVATKLSLEGFLQRQPGPAPVPIAIAMARVGEAIEASRSLAVEISPPVLQSGLCPALEWLRESKLRKYGLLVEVELATKAEPDPPIRDLLFQSARELLFNVVKHAGVDRALVRLTSDGEAGLAIEVRDQGTGCDPTTILARQPGQTGFGLFSIAQRLEALGGSLSVESTDEGTSVVMRAPLHVGAPASVRPSRQRAARAPKVPVAELAPEQAATATAVLIADDHEILEPALLDQLEQAGFEIVAEAGTADEAMVAAANLRPDFVLLHASLERRLGGIQLTRDLRSLLPDVRVIGLTLREDSAAQRGLRVAGAVACLARDRLAQELLPTLETAIKTRPRAAAAATAEAEGPGGMGGAVLEGQG
jgi:PAS domain S-box-containing protein